MHAGSASGNRQQDTYLDQQLVSNTNAGTTDGYFGQSFTAGRTGHLTKIEVQIMGRCGSIATGTLVVYPGARIPLIEKSSDFYLAHREECVPGTLLVEDERIAVVPGMPLSDVNRVPVQAPAD